MSLASAPQKADRIAINTRSWKRECRSKRQDTSNAIRDGNIYDRRFSPNLSEHTLVRTLSVLKLS